MCTPSPPKFQDDTFYRCNNASSDTVFISFSLYALLCALVILVFRLLLTSKQQRKQPARTYGKLFPTPCFRHFTDQVSTISAKREKNNLMTMYIADCKFLENVLYYCLQGQLCDLRLWFSPKRKMIGIRRIAYIAYHLRIRFCR